MILSLQYQPPIQDHPQLHLQPQHLLPQVPHQILPVQANQVHQDQDSASAKTSSSNLDSLLAKTIKNAQYRASDFARLGTFPYTSKIKPENLNLSLFAYGSVKHLLSLCNGRLKPCSKIEFQNCLQHLCHMFEIVCLSSSVSDFDSHELLVGREYDRKIIFDIEVGLKNWEGLNNCIDPTGWSYAK